MLRSSGAVDFLTAVHHSALCQQQMCRLLELTGGPVLDALRARCWQAEVQAQQLTEAIVQCEQAEAERRIAGVLLHLHQGHGSQSSASYFFGYARHDCAMLELFATCCCVRLSWPCEVKGDGVGEASDLAASCFSSCVRTAEKSAIERIHPVAARPQLVPSRKCLISYFLDIWTACIILMAVICLMHRSIPTTAQICQLH